MLSYCRHCEDWTEHYDIGSDFLECDVCGTAKSADEIIDELEEKSENNYKACLHRQAVLKNPAELV